MSQYKPYPAYKDSGVEWLGQVPEHWSVKKLKWLASLQSGDFITSESIEEEGAYPVYGGNGLRGYCTDFTHDGTYALVGRQGALCGNINYADGKFWASEHAVVVSPYVPTVVRWLGELLRAMNLGQYSVSSAQPGLAVERIIDLFLPVPPEDERQIIAANLDRETTRIDALIEKKTRFIELLREKRQALITHAVTKGLDPNVKMKDSGVEWLGEVPEHWDVLKVGRHATVITGFAFSSDGFSQDESKVRLLRGINVGVSRLRWDETVYWERKPDDRLEAYELSVGAIVLGMDRPWISEGMRIAIVQPEDLPCLLLQRVASIATDSFLNKEYLYLVLSSDLFKAGLLPDMTGLSVPHISAEQITGFRFALPLVEEQQAICEYVYQELERIDQLAQRTERSISLLKERRSALITAAVTGQIDLREVV